MPETFVLVHGAWHGGWAWRPVVARLRASGHRALAPTLPGLDGGADPVDYSLSDAVDHVVDFILDRDLHRVTLVGHSWAGYVITGAAPRLSNRLHKIVYWSAFVPEAGKALIDELPEQHRKLWLAMASESADNTVLPPYEIWQQSFIQDAPAMIQEMTYQLLAPQPFQYFTESVEPVAVEEVGVPISYLMSADDLVMRSGVNEWERYPRRLGVEPVAAPGSHEALLTRPRALAHALLRRRNRADVRAP